LGKPELDVSWEAADSLPPSLIEAYENEVNSEVEEQTVFHYGQEKHILAVKTSESTNAPKKARVERSVIENSTG
jgi:hypothetical protein